MGRNKIVQEILAERDYQVGKWGVTPDRELNRPNDWVTYITQYSSRWLNGTFAPYDRETLMKFRESMIKTATLAMAAIEATDEILEGDNYRPDIIKAL